MVSTSSALAAPSVPVWVDIGTPDIDLTIGFYQGLLGWKVGTTSPTGYVVLHCDGRPVAGVGATASPDQPSSWLVYVGVDDADAVVRRAALIGATTLVSPMDVGAAGRMAIIDDPTGASLAVWQSHDSVRAHVGREAGCPCWVELVTRHPAAASTFYAELFGWAEVSPDDADWRVDGRPIATLTEMSDEWPAALAAHWLVHFAVPDCRKAIETMQRLGGGVWSPPQARDRGLMAGVLDPLGARFVLVEWNDGGGTHR